MTPINFHTALLSIIEDYQYTEKEIAHICGCSIPTVKRWIAGTNEPHKFMQLQLLESLHAFAVNE